MGIGSAVAFGIERMVAPVEGMHEAIARRWFAALGPLGQRSRGAYTAGAKLVYGSIRLGAGVIGAAVDGARTTEHAIDDSAQAWVDGLWGDDLGRHQTQPMSVRDLEGRPLAMGPSVVAAFPEATGRLVVLVHGLVKTERSWQGTETEPGLAATLTEYPDLTPVLIRYNTGLAVGANAACLADLLDELVANWPVPVESISLVGHSMGGLVVSAAWAVGRRSGHDWIGPVSDVVTIGAPYRGAPLEKLVTMAAWGLGLAASTRPLAEVLNRRSRGIKDLGFGANSGEQAPETEPTPRHHIIAGVVTSDPHHPLGRLVGDLMVRTRSSAAPPGLTPASTVMVGGVNHFDMLHNPAVIDCAMGWLAPKD